jgi:hypothetical protein
LKLVDKYSANNEHQVRTGESTFRGVFGSKHLGEPNGTALFSVDALTQIAMGQITAAREEAI